MKKIILFSPTKRQPGDTITVGRRHPPGTIVGRVIRSLVGATNQHGQPYHFADDYYEVEIDDGE